MHTTMCFHAWLSGFLFPILGWYGGKPQRSSSVLCWPLIALAVAGIHDNSCSGYAGFWPWLLAAAPQRQGNAKTRVDGVLAALGSVVAGIRDSCSGYAGFWPWLLAAALRRQENAKTRVDRGSTRDFALYRGFGSAGLCRGRNRG